MPQDLQTSNDVTIPPPTQAPAQPEAAPLAPPEASPPAAGAPPSGALITFATPPGTQPLSTQETIGSLLVILVLVVLGGFGGWELGAHLGGVWLGIVGVFPGAFAVIGVLMLISYLVDPVGEGRMGADGKPEGAWVWRYSNGRNKREAVFANGVMEGAEVSYYADGVKRAEGANHDNRPEGPWIYWHADGSKASEGAFRAGLREGTWLLYWPGGKPRMQASYRNGVLHGTCTEWHEDGTARRRASFAYGVPADRVLRRVFDPELASKRGPWTILAWVVVLSLLGIVSYRDIFLVTIIMLFFLALIIHELGHFVAAMLVGIPIECFRIGFGPRLGALMCGQTRFEFGLFPVLGWVQPFQMRPDELQCLRTAQLALQRGEPMPELPSTEAPDKLRPASELVSRPRRLLFLAGGLAFNFSACILCAWVMVLRATAHEEDRELSPTAALVEAGAMTCQLTAHFFQVIPAALLDQLKPKHLTTFEPGPIAQLSSSMAQAASVEDGAESDSHLWWWLLVVFAAINSAVFCFNVLPIPPFDGFHGLRVLCEIILRRDLPDHYVMPLLVLGAVLLLYLLLSTVVSLIKDIVMTVCC